MAILSEARDRVDVALGTISGLKIISITRDYNGQMRVDEDKLNCLTGEVVRNVLCYSNSMILASTNSNNHLYQIDYAKKKVLEYDFELECAFIVAMQLFPSRNSEDPNPKLFIRTINKVFVVNLETYEKQYLFRSDFFSIQHEVNLQYQNALMSVYREPGKKQRVVIATLECSKVKSKDSYLNLYIMDKEFERQIEDWDF